MVDTPVSLLDRLCQQPDEPHWERFIMLFTPILARWGNRLGVPPTDIEDLLQDTYSTLFKQLPQFRYDPSKSFRAWLWTIFHRQTLAWRRRQLRDLPLSEKQLEALSSPDSIEEATEAEYRRVLIDRALRVVQTDFPEQTWRIFWQVTVASQPGTEVARQFGVTPNAVYLARSRVLARLRQELADLDR